MGFEVSAVMTVEIADFCVLILCSLAGSYQHFKGICSHVLSCVTQSLLSFSNLYPEGGGYKSAQCQNTENYNMKRHQIASYTVTTSGEILSKQHLSNDHSYVCIHRFENNCFA
jgi:hypothetical protein